MKKAEIDKLVVGSIIRHRGNGKEFKIVAIEEYFKIVAIEEYEVYTKSISDRDSRITTFNTLKRWYDVVNN